MGLGLGQCDGAHRTPLSIVHESHALGLTGGVDVQELNDLVATGVDEGNAQLAVGQSPVIDTEQYAVGVDLAVLGPGCRSLGASQAEIGLEEERPASPCADGRWPCAR